jgi:rhamnosyltransferase
MRTPRATIAIPTFNGEEFLRDQLEAIQRQVAPFGFETVIVDSGSTDATLAIIGDFPDVQLHRIPNAEFQHGRTRNLLASLAHGEIVVYLTQDAVPAHDRWLAEMVRPFDEVGERLAAVFGRQIPRPDCCPTVKRDVIGFFDSFGPKDAITVQELRDDMTQQERDAVGFLSNVNSAARTPILQQIPFPEVDYAEDQAFGRAITQAGYLKAYAPAAAVLHSHNLGPWEYFERMVDEFVGLREATGSTPEIPVRAVALGWIAPTISDLRFIASDDNYTRREKVIHGAQAPLYNVGRRVAMRIAGRGGVASYGGRFSRERQLKSR